MSETWKERGILFFVKAIELPFVLHERSQNQYWRVALTAFVFPWLFFVGFPLSIMAAFCMLCDLFAEAWDEIEGQQGGSR